MRWKGLITLLVLAALVIAAGFIFTNTWLEKLIERSASNALQSKVEIDNLDVSLLSLHFSWDSLQVADPKDPWKNMLTAGKTEFDMEFLPLLYKKKVIDNIQLSNVSWGGKRTTDGTWKTRKEKVDDGKPSFLDKTRERLQAKVDDYPIPDLSGFSGKVNVDSILALLDITSVQKIDSLQQNARELYSSWDKKFADFHLDDDLKDVETRLRAIKPDEIKTLTELQSSLNTVQSVRKEVDSLKTLISTTKSDLFSDLDATKSGLKVMDDWVREDISKVMDKAKLPDISRQQIGVLLFGGQVVGKVNEVLLLTQRARELQARFKSDKPKKESPPRFKGQTIHFSGKHVYPSFWIKHVELSGVIPEKYSFTGTLTDLVSQQPVIGKPTLLELKGTKGSKTAMNVTGEWNYLAPDDPQEHFKFALNGVGFKDVSLIKSEKASYLPQKIDKGVANINASLDILKDNMNGKVGFVGDGLSFDFPESKGGRADKLVREVFASVDEVTFDAGWKSNDNNTDFSLGSNLDSKVAGAMKSVVGKEVEQARAKIEGNVRERVNKERTKAEALVNEKNSQLRSRIQEYEDKVDEYRAAYEAKKKEIEDRIEAEKKKAENQVKDKLKSIIPGSGK